MGNFADAFKNRQNLGKNVQSETNERAQRNKGNGNPKGGEGRRENLANVCQASFLCCNNLRDRAMIDFLLSTGIREGELVRLNIDDIDFSERECVVYGKGEKERKAYFEDTR